MSWFNYADDVVHMEKVGQRARLPWYLLGKRKDERFAETFYDEWVKNCSDPSTRNEIVRQHLPVHKDEKAGIKLEFFKSILEHARKQDPTAFGGAPETALWTAINTAVKTQRGAVQRVPDAPIEAVSNVQPMHPYVYLARMWNTVEAAQGALPAVGTVNGISAKASYVKATTYSWYHEASRAVELTSTKFGPVANFVFDFEDAGAIDENDMKAHASTWRSKKGNPSAIVAEHIPIVFGPSDDKYKGQLKFFETILRLVRTKELRAYEVSNENALYDALNNADRPEVLKQYKIAVKEQPMHPYVCLAGMMLAYTVAGGVVVTPTAGLVPNSTAPTAGLTMSPTETVKDFDQYYTFLKHKIAYALGFVQRSKLMTTSLYQEAGSQISTDAEEWYAHTFHVSSDFIRVGEAFKAKTHADYMKAMTEVSVVSKNLQRAEAILDAMLPVAEVQFLEIALMKRLCGHDCVDVQKAKARLEEMRASKSIYFPLSYNMPPDFQKRSMLKYGLDEADLILTLMFGYPADAPELLQPPPPQGRPVHLLKGLVCMQMKDEGHELDMDRVVREYVIQAVKDYPHQDEIETRLKGLTGAYLERVLNRDTQPKDMVWNFGEKPHAPEPRLSSQPEAPIVHYRTDGEMYTYCVEIDGVHHDILTTPISHAMVNQALRGELKEPACVNPGHVCSVDHEPCPTMTHSGCHARYIRDGKQWAIWFILYLFQLANRAAEHPSQFDQTQGNSRETVETNFIEGMLKAVEKDGLV